MSSVLLDTHTLVWFRFGSVRIYPLLRKRIEAADILVSVVSIYEIDFKRRTRPSRALDSLIARMPDDMPTELPARGYRLLDIDAKTAWTAARLPILHRDPWDRLLLAHAQILDVPLISADGDLRDAAESHPSTAGLVVF